MSISGANKLELLQIAESVAQEKMIDRGLVIAAIEESLGKAASMKYGIDRDIRVSVDATTGQQTVTRVYSVVETVQDSNKEIALDEARKQDPNVQVNDAIVEELEPFDMGRIMAQISKQVLIQKVREAERERQYEEFKDRIGHLIVGIVKREEYGHIIVDLTRGEAILRRDQKIGRENYNNGDRLRAYITDVRKDTKGPQIFLSRTANEFMVELFRNEVPEVGEGTIEIRSVARDPGSRAKIAVASYDSSIDPVGSCVGMRGVRVQSVVNELGGERIDVIEWNDDPVEFIVRSLQPAAVSKVLLDEDGVPQQVVVPDGQLSLAIGRGGQNVRLARELTGFRDISIITESKEIEDRQAEVNRLSKELMTDLGIDEVRALLLVTEGFESAEIIADCNVMELYSTDGIDEDQAIEIYSKAQAAVAAKDQEYLETVRSMGVSEDLIEFDYLSPRMLLTLASAREGERVMSLAEFAACDMFELAGEFVERKGRKIRRKGLLEDCDVSLEEARQLVIRARFAAGILTSEEAESQLNEVEEPDGVNEMGLEEG